MGDHSVITINKEADAFYYRLRYWFNGKSGVIAEQQWGAVKWFYPEIADFAPYCTDAKSRVCTIYCETHSSDGTLIGETYTYITISVPSSLAPTLSVSTALVDGFNGNYLQNMSKCRLTMTATTQYQATVSSYTINGLTNAPNPYTSAVITESGSKTYTVTEYDSRGFSASITTQAINVLPYSLPSMTNITITRCLQDGTPATNGTYLSVYAKANYANISGNSASMSVAWKLTTASSYGTAVAVPSETATIVGGGNILAQRAYNVKLTITDTVGNTVDAVLTIPSDSVSINERAGNKGVGIGTYADEDNAFKVNTDWMVYMGGLRLAALLPNPTRIADSTNLNSIIKYGFYKSGSNASVATLTNCPADYAFTMVVYDASGRTGTQVSGTWDYAIQEITTIFGDKYIRAGNTGSSGSITWAAWKQIAMTAV
jgi:hypothetical protein